MVNYSKPRGNSQPDRPRTTREDIEKQVTFLNRSFANATFKAKSIIGSHAERSVKRGGVAVTTELYDLQVDFAYLIDNAQRSPLYIAPKHIQEAKDLITGIRALTDA